MSSDRADQLYILLVENMRICHEFCLKVSLFCDWFKRFLGDLIDFRRSNFLVSFRCFKASSSRSLLLAVGIVVLGVLLNQLPLITRKYCSMVYLARMSSFGMGFYARALAFSSYTKSGMVRWKLRPLNSTFNGRKFNGPYFML